jgi:hypothetical protein
VQNPTFAGCVQVPDDVKVWMFPTTELARVLLVPWVPVTVIDEALPVGEPVNAGEASGANSAALVVVS